MTETPSEPRGDRGKGWFGRSRLGVAAAYIRPLRRWKMLWAGVILAAILVLILAVDFGYRDARWVSNGPVSSAHAGLENDCSSCHDPLSRHVTVEACSGCHERHGNEIGDYSFASHYLYRTEDFQRVTVQDGEVACFSCHPEHEGRKAQRTKVDDRLCLSCHAQRSFSRDHPEFEVLADHIPDSPGIEFAHVPHVREVMKQRSMVDIEKACLSCHLPQADGRGFEAIDFDRQCDACHLTTAIATPRLAIDGEEDSISGKEVFGVKTLLTIRAEGQAGTEWSRFLSSTEFREAGGRVLKTPLYHRDPWILYNLRRMRRELYEDGGIAELLDVSPEAPEGQVRRVYSEAVETLERYVTGLRGRPEPEIQEELEVISKLLKSLHQRLNDSRTTLDETALLLALQQPREGVSSEHVEEVEDLVQGLVQPCVGCHHLEQATIARVASSQKTFHRAEFNHRAHILESRCLDCHSVIPIAEAVEDPTLPVPANDLSSTQNLPGIESCRTCHTRNLAADSCSTCHAFHPDLNRRSELLLYDD